VANAEGVAVRDTKDRGGVTHHRARCGLDSVPRHASASAPKGKVNEPVPPKAETGSFVASALSCDVEVTEAPGQGCDHPRPLVVVGPGDRSLDVAHWNGRTSIFRSQIFDASVASLSATSRSGASHTQTPARYSFDSTKGPSLNTACSPPVVDNRGRVGVRESARENPVALGDQSFVERADGRLPVCAAGIALVIDHGNQVLHLTIISCGVKKAWLGGQGTSGRCIPRAPGRLEDLDRFKCNHYLMSLIVVTQLDYI